MVFQDTVLADASLRDNLLAVNPNLTRTDLDRIAEAAMLTPILKQAPAGWDTPVGELGGQLSGGERQRVGIARALAKKAPLLLIDEATSALDVRNEHAIVDSIKQIRHNHTTVVVTHRPAMLELADVVIVMREGRIIEQGTRPIWLRHPGNTHDSSRNGEQPRSGVSGQHGDAALKAGNASFRARNRVECCVTGETPVYFLWTVKVCSNSSVSGT